MAEVTEEIEEHHLNEEHLQQSDADETIEEYLANTIDDDQKCVETENNIHYQIIDQDQDSSLIDDEKTDDHTIVSIDESEIARMQLESLTQIRKRKSGGKSDSSDPEASDTSLTNHQRIHVISSVVVSSPKNENQNGDNQTPNRPISRDIVPGTIEIPKELILGTQDITSPIMFTPECNTSSSRSLQNEDLIAILEGGDDDDDDNDGGQPSPTRVVATDSNASAKISPPIETEQKPQETTTISTTATTTTTTKHSPIPKATTGLLSKDLERRIAMEQMLALPTKQRKPGRKQKLVAKELVLPSETPKKSAANDLINSLVSEWSDNESKSENNDDVVSQTASIDEATSSTTTTKAVVAAPTTKKSTKNASTSNEVNKKKQLNSVEPTTFKRSRIIKKKIIWDPDAPETAISYASLVTSSSVPKKKSKVEKEQPIVETAPNESAPEKPTQTKKKVVSAKTNDSTTSKNNKRETASATNLKAKKRKSSDSPSSINRKKKLSEIDKLLGDEGAINMLNALKQDSNDAVSGGGADISDTESIKSETRSNKNDSKSEQTMIQNRSRQRTVAVQKQANTLSSSSLSPSTTTAKKDATGPTKKRSPTKKTSASSSWDYIYSDRPDDSMIIRRRSNSSYSSTTSPNRLSVELTPATTTVSTTSSSTTAATKPIANKKTKASKEKFEFAKPNAKKLLKDEQKSLTTSAHSIVNDLSATETNLSTNRRSKRAQTVTASAAIAASSSNDSAADQEVNAVDKIDGVTKTKQKDSYEELLLKRHKNFVEILLAPETSKDENLFTIQLMKSVCDALTNLANDNTCKLVLLLAANDTFCNGLDYSTLIQSSAEKRKTAAKELATVVRTFFNAIASFKKPIIAGVTGQAIGIGVTFLPLFDMVFASDNATFKTNYGKIGQIPEGCSILSATNRITELFKNELTYQCETYTVSYADKNGLVIKIENADKFHETLIKRCEQIAIQSMQSLEMSKSILQCEFLTKLQKALTIEQNGLIQNWTSSECQENLKN